MKGYAVRDEDEATGPGNLLPWEALAIDAVGNVIDFWRFKRNQGRVWALLYLRDVSYTAAEIQEALGLSKGAVSMLTRELEQWGVVARVRATGDGTWRFAAQTDFLRMLGRVIEEREGTMVRRVLHDLTQAETLARVRGGASPEVIARIARMKLLANAVEKALRTFVQTARIDVGAFVGVLAEVLPFGRRRGRRR